MNGYGYSVWYVPNNYKELQQRHNMVHIPHITLETNLILRDAFHIYRNAPRNIEVEYIPKLVKFPQCYEHDPLMGIGWYVDVPFMKNRKPWWKPHMSSVYIARGTQTIWTDYQRLMPPPGKFDCFITIADTQSIVPSDWRIDLKYFNIKASNSCMIESMEPTEHALRNSINTDEYIAIDVQACQDVYGEVAKVLEVKGLQLNQTQIDSIVKYISKDA